MFTGIIEEVGKIISVSANRLAVDAKFVLSDTKIGDSIAVNGVCLTVVNIGKNSFSADVSHETLKVTALKYLKPNMFVNLERALISNGRFGGHIVTGHIDCVGVLTKIVKNNEFYDVQIKIPDEYTKYVVNKGSIAVNGISLTVADIKSNIVSIAIIPHTFQTTVLRNMEIGSFVNIETDILSKYVEKFLSTSDNKSGISMEFLRENGF